MNRVSKWLMKRAMMQMSFEAAKILCVVGGLVVLISGVYFFALSHIALGLVATVVSGQVKHLLWNVIIVVLGAIAYYMFPSGGLWNYGAMLVIAAGIIGAITHII